MKNLTDEELYKLAKKRVVAKKSFTIHLFVFIVVSALLVAISLYNNANWFIFPVGGWAIGIVIHFICLRSFLGSNDEVEQEMMRLKKQNRQ